MWKMYFPKLCLISAIKYIVRENKILKNAFNSDVNLRTEGKAIYKTMFYVI